MMHLLSQQDVQQAAQLLEAGQLVAFPTETVYGLGADADNARAVARIFALKSRPAGRPLSLHILPDADLTKWVQSVPDIAHDLMAAFWPGPLTLILNSAHNVPEIVTAGLKTVGLRCPSHPVAMALLRAFKGGQGAIAAPSANRSGAISPTCASHVLQEFGNDERLAAIVDAGESPVGIESTIVDLTKLSHQGLVVLRTGAIAIDAISRVVPHVPIVFANDQQKHYRPKTLAFCYQTTELKKRLQAYAGKRIALLHYHPVDDDILAQTAAHIALPHTHEAYAHGLYAAIRELDTAGCDLILIESVPDTVEWLSIRDRLEQVTG